ncbi:STN domain-containing protein [Pannonibacter sp. Pt2-lr]
MALNGSGKSGGLRRTGLLLAATLLTPVAIMTAGTAEVRAQATSQQFSFNIAAKPVPQAVNDIGRITGLAVVVRENQAITRAGNPVRGSMTAAEALTRLLRGTGLPTASATPARCRSMIPLPQMRAPALRPPAAPRWTRSSCRATPTAPPPSLPPT